MPDITQKNLFCRI